MAAGAAIYFWRGCLLGCYKAGALTHAALVLRPPQVWNRGIRSGRNWEEVKGANTGCHARALIHPPHPRARRDGALPLEARSATTRQYIAKCNYKALRLYFHLITRQSNSLCHVCEADCARRKARTATSHGPWMSAPVVWTPGSRSATWAGPQTAPQPPIGPARLDAWRVRPRRPWQCAVAPPGRHFQQAVARYCCRCTSSIGQSSEVVKIATRYSTWMGWARCGAIGWRRLRVAPRLHAAPKRP